VFKIDEHLNNIQPVQEGFYFSDKTISIDLNKFKEKKHRLLFVMGGNGTGKTTLAYKLTKEFKVKSYETDEVLKIVVKKYKYNSGEDPFALYFNEIKNLISNIKGRAIIEGVGLIYVWDDFIKQKYFKNSSYIIMGLSHIRGTIRKLIRNSKGVAPYWKDVDQMLMNWIDNGMKKEKRIPPPFILLRDIRNYIKQSNRKVEVYKI